MNINLENRAIYFDMDGTIANFYGVENWLENLQREITRPYRIARPLINMRTLARELNRLQNLGYTIGIISWLCRNGSENYNNRVTQTKENWLRVHLGSVHWNEIHIVEYGTPKEEIAENSNGILFDDEIQNRENWNGVAYDVNNIIEILRGLN